MDTTADIPSGHIDPHLLEQLPTLPGTAAEFLRLCDDHTVGVADVASVAQRDPALLARILQVANSPFYAPRQAVTDGTRAAAVLGLRNLKLIGVGFAVVGDLWTGIEDSDALSGIVGASAMAGSGAQSFSTRVGTGRDEEAFTAGLLSFIGELALLRCYPDEFAELWTEVGGMPTVRQQLEALGADGPTVGALLMERWSIPLGLHTGVRMRQSHLVDRLAMRSQVFDASLGFGTAIAELITRGEGALERLRPAARSWGFDDEDLIGFWAEFRLAVRRADRQLGLSVGADLDALIVDDKDEYMSSMVRAATELESARNQIEELRAENQRLEGLSMLDPLTGIPNRPALQSRLRALLAKLIRRGGEQGVAVVMFDLDKFKLVNDSLGHPVGDLLLREVAGAAHHAVRTDEIFARLGGDEFAMVLEPETTAELLAAAERIRKAMTDAIHELPYDLPVTVSAGASLVKNPADDIEVAVADLIRSADDALYDAKHAGRNQVVAARGELAA
ncbi:MAG: diguanylate cyclase [Acidimicrobiales bacterium]